MTIGAVLLRPQRLERATGRTPDAALGDDVVSLFGRVALDQSQGGRVLAVMGEAMEAAGQRLLARSDAGRQRAEQRILAWIEPLARELPALAQQVAAEEPGQIAGRIAGALGALAERAGNLSVAALRAHLAEGLDVLRSDLGITEAFLEEQIWAVFDDVVARLRAEPAEPDAAVRANRLEIIALLGRLKRRLGGLFTFPALDSDRLAGELTDFLRRIGLDAGLRRAATAGGALGDLVSAAGSLTDLASVRVSVSGPQATLAPLSDAPVPPSGSERYAWYATSLLDEDDNLFGTDDLKKPADLVNKLKSAADPLSRYLKERFTPALRGMINGFTGPDAPSETLLRTLVFELNGLVRGDLLHDSQRFAGVTLEEDTRKKLDKFGEMDEDDRLLLNRMLLEDAYRNELDRLTRNGFLKLLEKGFSTGLDLADWPGDKVFVDPERHFVLKDDQPLLAGQNVDWPQAPAFDPDARTKPHFTFEKISPEFIEGWTYHSSWGLDTVNAVLDVVGLATEEGKRLPNGLSALFNAGHAGIKLGARRPISGFDFWGHKALEWTYGGPLVLATLGALPAIVTYSGNNFSFWITLWMDAAFGGSLKDWPEMVRLAAEMLRDGSLSVMTLLNFDGPKDPPSGQDNRPDNRNKLDPVVALSELLFAYVLASLVKREDYVDLLSFESGTVIAYWLLGGIGMGLLAGFVGTVVGEIIAWAEDWVLLGWTLLKSVARVIVKFYSLFGAIHEGDTDGGKYNPGNTAFGGYPEKTPDSSPYFLPYESGKSRFCGQGNQGGSDHNKVVHKSGPSLVYAYDFALNEDEEVLASRPGTVVQFFDEAGDDVEEGLGNFIVIRHDRDDAGAPAGPDAAHDRSSGGAPVVTFAVYGHGRQNGVFDAFKGRGLTRDQIVGQTVWRGQPILRAGKIGKAGYHQVHMHVVPEQSPGSGAPADSFTIPFVFQDVADEGVCETSTWYTSGNARVA